MARSAAIRVPGVRRARLAAADLVDALLRRRPPLTPPRRLHSVGGGDYHAVGRAYFDRFRDLADLRPDDRVLDVGCGTGRLAVPLIDYLTDGGSYAGFDVNRRAVEWCQRHITPVAPNFRFFHLDVYNGKYNRRGAISPSELAFPFPHQAFTFTVAASVFTHMLPQDVDRYVAEIGRTLSPGGRAFLTFFIYDDDSGRDRGSANAVLDFSFEERGYRTTAPDRPEESIAVCGDLVRSLLRTHGLEVVEPIRYGFWADGSPSDRRPWLQDIVVARRI